MGVDRHNQVITGTFFTYSELGKKFIDKYFMVDNEKTFGDKVQLIQLNPYGGKSLFNGYIIGMIDKREEDDGDRAGTDDKEVLEELTLNQDSYELVKEQLEKNNLSNDQHPIKTYRIVYFT